MHTQSNITIIKSGTNCYHVVTRLMTVADLLQVVPTRLTQAVRNKLLRACCHQLVTCRRYQTCWNNLLRVCWPHQPCYKMITTCSRLANNWEQAVRTHLVDKLWDFYAWSIFKVLQTCACKVLEILRNSSGNVAKTRNCPRSDYVARILICL